jgi:protein translocase SecG subunit
MNIISITQIIVSVLIIVLILLQERSAGVSAIFGGGDGDIYQTRRGLERLVFGATIVLIVIFVILSILSIKQIAI